jgi:hypothetical protein
MTSHEGIRSGDAACRILLTEDVEAEVPAEQSSACQRKEREMKGYRKVVMLALIAALQLAGCAAIQRSEAKDKEQLLVAAGFQAKPADTPEKVANLKTMPPRKLVSQAKDGKFVYSYADPDYCQCLYVGGPTEYSAYQRLAVQKEIAEEQREAAMDWGMWGPWWWE